MVDYDDYTVPGTKVLKNKLGITDHTLFGIAEDAYSTNRTKDVKPLKDFSLDEYKSIHKTLFQDMYDWAGEPRYKAPYLDGVGSAHFMPLDQGLKVVKQCLATLRKDKNQLAKTDNEQFSKVASSIFATINEAHIFRAPGRIQRQEPKHQPTKRPRVEYCQHLIYSAIL